MEDARVPADRNFVLLGIKYEAAMLGGVEEAGLAVIEEQIRAEVGDSWASNPMVVRGRNAVRAEHGLSPLGEKQERPTEPAPPKRPLWRRFFG